MPFTWAFLENASWGPYHIAYVVSCSHMEQLMHMQISSHVKNAKAGKAYRDAMADGVDALTGDKRNAGRQRLGSIFSKILRFACCSSFLLRTGPSVAWTHGRLIDRVKWKAVIKKHLNRVKWFSK